MSPYRKLELGFLVQFRPVDARASILSAVLEARGNVSAAAEDAFGLNKRTLQRYIKALGIQQDVDGIRRLKRGQGPRWRKRKPKP